MTVSTLEQPDSEKSYVGGETRRGQASHYAMIVGQGRSGTNWLLRLFDLSVETHCRNEPNELAGSRLAALESSTICGRQDKDFGERWDEAVRWAARRTGRHDHALKQPKQFVYEPIRRLGGARVANGPRFRRLWSLLPGSAGREEWPLPWWLVSRDRLEQSLCVLKFVQTPGWAVFVLGQRPEVPVIHIVRHPGGFLDSWSRRYLARHDVGEVTAANRQRLEAIAETEQEWAARFGDIASMDADESELWYWRYANESVFVAGQGHSAFHFVLYEDLVARPVEVMRRLYDVCGLRWERRIEAAVQATTGRSADIAGHWRKEASPERLALLDRVLESSLMRDWWDGWETGEPSCETASAAAGTGEAERAG